MTTPIAPLQVRALTEGDALSSSPPPLSALEVSDQLGYARSVFETVRQPLLLLDGVRQVHMANAAFFRAFGTTSGDTVGHPVGRVAGGQFDRSQVKDLLLRLQVTGEPFEDIEIVCDVPESGTRTLLVTGRLLNAPHNADRMTLLAIIDITERRRGEKALAWHAAELERSNRDLAGFALVASHDLQEPLRKIQAYGDLLVTECGETLDDVARDYVTRMVSASTRMRTLVADVLRLATVGRERPRFMKVNLGDVIRDVLVDMEVGIREAGALVEVSSMPTIECDRPQMRQLFQNIISNALKFRRDVPCEIRVDVVATRALDIAGTADAAPLVAIEVSDNGIGFESRHAETIFAPFQRLHGRGKYAGTGIGLALCRRICELHFGTIAVASTPGVGTIMTVTLPTRQPLHQ